jgi:DNA modification methylase
MPVSCDLFGLSWEISHTKELCWKMKPYYQDKWVTIYHGDCREILPSLDVKVDLVLTDPPYGVGFQYDDYVDDEQSFNDVVLPIIVSMVGEYSVATCISMRQMWKLPQPKWMLCWYKPGSTRRNSVGGWSIWEPIFIYGDGWKVANDAILLPDCVNHDKDGNKHPCPKPINLFTWILSLRKSEIVLDPFCGSGTTLMAAKKLNIQSVGIEISEKYCEIAAKRCSQEVMELSC